MIKSEEIKVKSFIFIKNIFLVFVAQLLFTTLAWADIALSFTEDLAWTWPAATIGWEFSIAEPIPVYSLGVWDEGHDGLSDDHIVGIWSIPDGTLLTSTTVTSGDTLVNGFRYASISAITLPAGSYVIGAYMPTGADRGAADAIYSTTAPVVYERNLYLYDQGFVLPTDEWVGYDGGNFGPNFEHTEKAIIVTEVPTMSIWGLAFLIGLLGFLGYRRRVR